MLCHALGTSVLPIPPTSQAPYMRVLRLPELKDFNVSQEDAERAMQYIVMNLNCVAGLIVCFSGHLWLRISGDVMNTKEDYVALKAILLTLVNQ